MYIVIIVIIMFLFLLIIIISQSLKTSKKFWKKSEELKDKINQTNSIEKLFNLYKIDFKELQELSSGEYHRIEVSYIYGLLSGKIKGIIDLKDITQGESKRPGVSNTIMQR